MGRWGETAETVRHGCGTAVSRDSVPVIVGKHLSPTECTSLVLDGGAPG
jgi:hypothetical protein